MPAGPAGRGTRFGSVVASFNDFGTSRLLTPFGLPGDATSSPSGQSYQGHAEAGYHWALSGRRHECQRHALRGLGLRERASRGLHRDRRLRRALGERGGRELLPDDVGRAPHLAHRDRRVRHAHPRSFASAGTTNSSTPRKRSRPRSSACRGAPSPRPASSSAATPRSWARASAWSSRPTPKCSSITTAGSAHGCRSIPSRGGLKVQFKGSVFRKMDQRSSPSPRDESRGGEGRVGGRFRQARSSSACAGVVPAVSQ